MRVVFISLVLTKKVSCGGLGFAGSVNLFFVFCEMFRFFRSTLRVGQSLHLYTSYRLCNQQAIKSNKYISEGIQQRLANPLRFRTKKIRNLDKNEELLVPLFNKPELYNESNTTLQSVILMNLFQPNVSLHFLVPLVDQLIYSDQSKSKAIILTPNDQICKMVYENCFSLFPDLQSTSVIYTNISVDKEKKFAKIGEQENREPEKIIILSLASLLQSGNNGKVYKILEGNLKTIIYFHMDLISNLPNVEKEIKSILGKCPSEHSSIAFSSYNTASMNEFVAQQFKSPLWINLIGEEDKKELPKDNSLKIKNVIPIPTSNIQHHQIQVDENDRFACLIKLLTIYGGKRNLVFLNSVSLIQDLGEYVFISTHLLFSLIPLFFVTSLSFLPAFLSYNSTLLHSPLCLFPPYSFFSHVLLLSSVFPSLYCNASLFPPS